jgi:hypothetical protein
MRIEHNSSEVLKQPLTSYLHSVLHESRRDGNAIRHTTRMYVPRTNLVVAQCHEKASFHRPRKYMRTTNRIVTLTRARAPRSHSLTLARLSIMADT